MKDQATPVWINKISTAVPPYDVHRKFLEYAPTMLPDERQQRMFARLSDKAQIEHRYSVVQPSNAPGQLDTNNFYRRGKFPSTAERMQLFEKHALPLALKASREVCGNQAAEITHLIVTTCTGMSAPGLDLQLQRALGLHSSVERTVIGFMGCYAAINGLKAARHMVRSEPGARVLLVNLELSTLHLHESADLESLLGFMQFADGCAVSMISAEPRGLELGRFHCDVMPEARELITWNVGDSGFGMELSPQVPLVLGSHLEALISNWIKPDERADLGLWAVHPGGRAILDAVEKSLTLKAGDLKASREVLREFGNMSSATVMFVLRSMLEDRDVSGNGVAMAFGPGLTLESMLFRKA
jgi:predicted naringenin-chalcone synthase